MFCYNCGCNLSEHDFCTNCGADVSQYKRIMYISNRFYNDGLEKAGIRDLSGAIESLRQCLKFNKNNVEARNLLGLVYFETGEVVAALSEWVISINLRPKKNIADDYIRMVQANPSRLESINQTIKKYNQALTYCSNDGLDLAVIQLKKVISLNPRFIRARQLLALLYINSEEWEKAQNELLKCQQIDRGNTTTQRYLKEVEKMLAPIEGGLSARRRARNEEDVIRYQSDNEVIIQPINGKESRGISTLINLGIGLLIGLAMAWYLILPAKIQNATTTADTDKDALRVQIDTMNADIKELQQKLNKAESDREYLQEQLDGYQLSDGELAAVDYLMQAVSVYLTNPEDLASISGSLEQINVDEGTFDEDQSANELYNVLISQVGTKLADNYYTEGYSFYSNGDYEMAIDKLTKACMFDSSNGEALYCLAQSYRLSENDEEAAKYFKKVVDNFPGTEKAAQAETILNQINSTED